MSAVLQTVALLALYVALEWLSFLHEHNELPVTPWNPGLGVLVAMIVLRGWPMGLVLFAGVVLAQSIVVRSELPLTATVAMGAAVAATYSGVAMLARGKLQLGPELLRTRDVLILVMAGVAGAVAVSLQLGLVLLSIRHFQLNDIASTSVPLILGDAIGIAVVTPLVLRAGHYRVLPGSLSAAFGLEVSGLCAAIALALLLVVQSPGLPGQGIFYLLFVPVVIAAVRYGMDGACAALALTQLGLVTLLHWYGFELSRFTDYQVLMLVLTVTGLVVGGLVSERTASAREAEAARQMLHNLETQSARRERLNLASGMAAALAHEINQPMTAARALARSVQELMRAPVADAPRIERNLASMVNQIDHASEVVKRMREFVRRGEPHVSTLDIQQVLGEALSLVEPLVRSRRIRIEVEAAAGLPPIFGDRVQVQQVVINLVKNAFDSICESAISEGRIVVSARAGEDGHSVEIAVRDNGPGVAAGPFAALFEPLNTSRDEGLGLGLSICKSIVQAHGGKIWLSSSEPGRTEFRFTLPAQGHSISKGAVPAR